MNTELKQIREQLNRIEARLNAMAPLPPTEDDDLAAQAREQWLRQRGTIWMPKYLWGPSGNSYSYHGGMFFAHNAHRVRKRIIDIDDLDVIKLPPGVESHDEYKGLILHFIEANNLKWLDPVAPS